jgi:FAD/FMN-containing dehydrogenase
MQTNFTPEQLADPETAEANHPEPPAVAALTAGLRARFDPKGILNPGRMATERMLAET